MLRHIVLIRWRAEASEEQRQAARNAIVAFPSQVPEIVSLQCGDGLLSGPTQYDFAVVLDFPDRSAWKRYIEHPAHRAYAEGPGRTAVATLASVQHEW